MSEPPVCLVCKGVNWQTRPPMLRRCVECGFVTADLEVSPDVLRGLYTSKYFAGAEYHDYVAERPLLEKHFRRRMKTLLRHIPDAHDRHLFEIGSAYGFFLAEARRHFKSVAGIDLSTDAVAYAVNELKLPAVAGDFLNHPLDHPLDIVCMWDTIEHVQHPDLYLERISAHTGVGGVIAITTGDIGSAMARLRGARWRQIHPPTHLHYFSKATLTRLLHRCGFTVRYAGSDGAYRSLDMVAHIILKVRHNQPRVYNTLKRTGLLGFGCYLNLYDIMYLIAVRR
jgi:SAM-dependent methyltransferase